MAHKTGHIDPHQVAEHAAEWLDGKLFRVFGPPPLGPYDDDVDAVPAGLASCPLCGELMSQHEIEHEGAQSFLHCPEHAVTDTPEPSRVV